MENQDGNNEIPLEESASYVRLALPLMSQYNIPITPRNYAVWYDYVSGKSRELREMIDSMIGRAEDFTSEINDMLYHRFCSEVDETALTELRENLRKLLIDIFSQVAQLTEQADEYEAIVSKSTVAENIRVSFSEGRLKRVKTSEYVGKITISIGGPHSTGRVTRWKTLSTGRTGHSILQRTPAETALPRRWMWVRS